MTAAIYREATEADLPAMFELWWEIMSQHEGYDERWWHMRPKEECLPLMETRWRDFIASEEHVVLVTEVDGAVVGLLVAALGGRPPVMHDLTTVGVNMVGVTAAHRRRGHCRAMMTRLEAFAHDRGAEAITLGVYADNPAVAAYRKLGFEVGNLSMRRWL